MNEEGLVVNSGGHGSSTGYENRDDGDFITVRVMLLKLDDVPPVDQECGCLQMLGLRLGQRK
jgi:hypothetical protein